jgi:hypothetical protein
MRERRQFFRVPEVARRYTLKPRTVYKWIERGILKEEHGLMRIGGLWLIAIKVFEKNPVVRWRSPRLYPHEVKGASSEWRPGWFPGLFCLNRSPVIQLFVEHRREPYGEPGRKLTRARVPDGRGSSAAM